MDIDTISPVYGHRTHTNTDEYTYRVPTPPRIVVPPPALNANAIPEFDIATLEEEACFPKLSSVPLVSQNNLLDLSLIHI